MYTEYLSRCGLPPIPLSTAREALVLVPSAEILITGILLPGDLDGVGLVLKVRSNEPPPVRALPIIVLTACAWDTERQRAFEAGCDVFLTKPCLPKTLVSTILNLLGWQPHRRPAEAGGSPVSYQPRRSRAS
jgi:CheY-like chemotaxis protein